MTGADEGGVVVKTVVFVCLVVLQGEGGEGGLRGSNGDCDSDDDGVAKE